MVRCFAVALALAAVGCSGAASPNDGGAVDAPAVVVDLGTGRSAFEALPDESELELISGPQGGWHVWVSTRIWASSLDGARIDYEAVPVGGTTPISMPTELDLTGRVVREGDHWLRAGDFLVMAVTGPSGVVGMHLEITARVTDAAGHSGESSRTVHIVDEVNELMP